MAVKSFGERIVHYRKKAGLLQKDLAEKAGISPTALNYYEKDKREPNVLIIKKIAAALNITGDELLGITGLQNSSPLSSAAQRAARLYDKADDRAREIVDFTLKPFDNGHDASPQADTEAAEELAPDIIDFEPKITDLPLYTQSVAAGIGNYLDSDDYEIVGFANAPRRANIAVRITGDSMESLYHDGDIVFVETESMLNEGEIGIFNYESNGYIKKLMFNPPRLVSLNKKYPPIYITEDSQCYTIGRVLGKQ